MSRLVRHIMLCYALLFSVLLIAGDPSSGKSVDKDRLVIPVKVPETVVPGKFSSFILEVNNPFEHDLELTLSVNMPSSWHLLSKNEKIVLNPKEKRNVIFLVKIDRVCEVGIQEISFAFKNTEYDFKVEETYQTEVENVRNVIINILRKPRYITASDDYQVDFEIRNLGNCDEEILVSSLNGQFQKKKYQLPPRGTILISVENRSIGSLKQISYITAGLIVDVGYQTEQITITAPIKAYPDKTTKTDKYHRLPIRLGATYIGAQIGEEGFNGGYQLEAVGSGYLDQNKRHQLDFTVRAPNRFELARVGTFDQYSAEYTYHKNRLNKTTVRVGDFNYGLTRVTELQRFARGVGIAQTIGKLEVGGFINSPRFIGDIDFQFATYGAYQIDSVWQTKVSYMQKIYADSADNAHLISFQNTWQLKKHAISLDLSPSIQNGNIEYGGSIIASGSVGRFAYTTSNIYASPEYAGYFSNSLISNSNLNYKLGKLNLVASLFYNESNPERDTLFTVAPYSVSYQGGVAYSISKNWNTRLTYISRAREDRFPQRKFAFRENGFRYFLNMNKKNTQAQFIGEILQTENLLITADDNTSTTYLAALDVSQKLTRGLSINAFTQYFYTNRFSLERESLLFYGGGISYNFKRFLRLNASYRNNYSLDEYAIDRTLFDLRANVELGNHEIVFSGSSALVRRSINRQDYFVSVGYYYRLGAPLKRKEGLYAINGQVNAVNPKDAAGIILTIAGQTVVTDPYGHFVINDVPEGVHYMYIDNGSIKSGLLPDIDYTSEVFVYPKDQNTVVFNLVRGASIKGNLNIQQSQSEKLNKEPLPIKIVKITSGNREFLTYSDAKGNYNFANLVPGKWVLRVVNAEEGGYTIVENNKTIDLKPADKGTIDFEINKNVRNIKFSKEPININIKKN